MARTGQRQRPYDRIVTLWEQFREAWKRIDALKAECDWLARDRKGHVLPVGREDAVPAQARRAASIKARRRIGSSFPTTRTRLGRNSGEGRRVSLAKYGRHWRAMSMRSHLPPA